MSSKDQKLEEKETDEIDQMQNETVASQTEIVNRLPGHVTKEETNFLRFCHLVQKVAPQAVRWLFDREFPPSNLEEIIKKNLTMLMDLKKKRIISAAQWKLLLPYGKQSASMDFDTTLMICLVRHLTTIKPLSGDYDQTPPDTDISLGADLARIKHYRNYLAHCMEGNREIDTKRFHDWWETISKAISRIGGQELEHECNNLLNANLDSSLMEVYRDILLKDLEQKELKEEIENMRKQLQDPLLPHQREIVRDTVEQWRIDDQKFVDTNASKFLYKTLETNNVAIITGSPGSGKSFTAKHVLLCLEKEGFDIMSMGSVSGILTTLSRTKRQAFFVDNLCGKFNISVNDIEEWERNREEINRIFSNPLTKCVFACRLQIYKDPEFENLKLQKIKVCNLSGSQHLSLSEKTTIGQAFLDQSQLNSINQETITQSECFPLLCSLHSTQTHEFNVHYFEKPVLFFTKELDDLKLTHNKLKYACIVLCVLFNDKIDSYQFEASAEDRFRIEMVLEECGINNSIPKKFILSHFESMVGTYFCKTESGYKSIHDYMFCIFCSHVSTSMLNVVIEHADSEVLSDLAYLESLGDISFLYAINIPKVYEDIFFARIVKDLLDGRSLYVFSAYQMKYKEYRLKLVSLLQTLTDDINSLNGDVSPLYSSSQYGHIEIVEVLIDKGANVNQHDKSGKTALYAASGNGHEDVIDLLLRNGADVNLCNVDGHSPLYAASLNGNKSCVDNLLRKGADVDHSENDAFPPLYGASHEGYTEIAKYLVSKGANVNKCTSKGFSPLFIASKGGHDAIVRILLENGANVNQSDYIGRSSLYTASFFGHIKCVEFLIRNGADLNSCSSDGTPLYTAAYHGSREIAELLLKSGANINLCRYTDGFSPLCAASFNGRKSCVQLLLDSGADINKANYNGLSPLYMASQEGKREEAAMLVDRGANINSCSNYGFTPLLVACKNGNDGVVDVLLKGGADISICDKSGQSALHIASLCGRKSCISRLLKENVDVNKRNKDGATSLYISSSIGKSEIVEILLDHGANINQPDEEGKSPLYISCNAGHLSVVKILLDRGAEVNQCTNKGDTPLCETFINCHDNCREMLLKHGAQIICSSHGSKSSE